MEIESSRRVNVRGIWLTSCRSAADGGIRHQRSSKHPVEIKPEELEIDWPHHGGDHHRPTPPPTSSRPSAETACSAAQRRQGAHRACAEEPRPGATLPGRLEPPTWAGSRRRSSRLEFRPPSALLGPLPATKAQEQTEGACPLGLAGRQRGRCPQKNDKVRENASAWTWRRGALQAGRPSCRTSCRCAAARSAVRHERRVRHGAVALGPGERAAGHPDLAPRSPGTLHDDQLATNPIRHSGARTATRRQGLGPATWPPATMAGLAPQRPKPFPESDDLTRH